MLVALLLLLALRAYAVLPSEVPEWVLTGIMMVETRSYYCEDGTIAYIDRRIGAAGERGPFQMKLIAFQQVATKGESFKQLSRDPLYAEYKACQYLAWLYNGPAKHSWARTIHMYNAGPGKRSTGYYNLVLSAAKREGAL